MRTESLPPAPAPGEIVRVRQRQYLVEDVQPPPEAGEATLVSMSCLDDDAQGEALEVLWEQEIDKEQAGTPPPTAPGKKPRGRGKTKKPTPAGQGGLFGEEND